EVSLKFGLARKLEADRMRSAKVRLDRREMICDVALFLGVICGGTRTALLLVHPCDETYSAFWTQAEILQDRGDGIGCADTGRIVDRSLSKVPRIEMSGDDDVFIRLFRAFQVRDDVVAFNGRKGLRRQRQVHLYRPEFSEVRDRFGVFVGYGTARDLWDSILITHQTGMREPTLRTACRADDRGDRTVFRR